MSDLTIKQQVEQARNPQEALLVIAEALDGITSLLISDLATGPRDEWGEWQAKTTEDDDGNVTVEIVPPPEDVFNKRLDFAKNTLKIHEIYDDPNVDMIGAYAKGGPLWLYNNDRDLVISLPEDIRRAMVQDLNELSPEEATLMANDIMKQQQEPPTLGI